MRRILIADDDDDLRPILTLALEIQYDVVAVPNGARAIQQLVLAPFDLLLLDLMMPVLDGRGVVEEMRRRGIMVPVVLLTGESDATSIAAELDVSACLEKPVTLPVLRATVARVLNMLRAERARMTSAIG
jgi:CheY-like chemotaxis protein